MSQPPSHPALPARGALAGIKGDLARAKDGNSAYDPRGAGGAWSHAFLNQKPWHPLNFRNQIRKFEAEQQHIQEQKIKEQAKVEFDAEQDYLKTLSYLSPAEQQRYKQIQSVSFMYAKPPGLDAALAKEAEQAKKAPQDASCDAAGPGPSSSAMQQQPGAARQQSANDAISERNRVLDRVREDPYAAMLTARAALQNNAKFVLRHGGGGRSPGHGGIAVDESNQQYLIDAPEEAEDEDHGMALLLAMPHEEQAATLKKLQKLRKKQLEEQQLQEAEAILRAAGYDLDTLVKPASNGKHKKKSKKAKKTKSTGKKQKRDRGSSSESDSSFEQAGVGGERISHNEHKRHRHGM